MLPVTRCLVVLRMARWVLVAASFSRLLARRSPKAMGPEITVGVKLDSTQMCESDVQMGTSRRVKGEDTSSNY